MPISKIILNGVTQMDVTQDTVDSDTLLSNETATKKNGQKVTGMLVVADMSAIVEITKNIIPLKSVSTTSQGVTITTDPETGKVTASGTAAAAGYVDITDVITLPAGTYTLSPNGAGHLYFQVRSTDNVKIGQTGVDEPVTITLAAETSFKIRATWTASYDETTYGYPQMESGSTTTYFVPHLTAKDVITRHDVNSLTEDVAAMKSDNTIMEYTTDTFASDQNNTGTNLTIMTYNLAKYDHDTSPTVYIPTDKLFNFKKLLNHAKADIICTQEDREYIDESTKSAPAYLYRPIYRRSLLGSGGGIYVKSGVSDSHDNMAYTVGTRSFQFARYAIGNKKLLMVTAHPTPGNTTESEEMREQEYTDLMEFVNNVKQLTSLDGQRTKYRPDWDYCIICGDFNSVTNADKSLLKSLCAQYGFSLANGGWLGWIETGQYNATHVAFSHDNILCSSSVIINNVTSYKSWYDNLYSDHYPLVANVTLLSE